MTKAKKLQQYHCMFYNFLSQNYDLLGKEKHEQCTSQIISVKKALRLYYFYKLLQNVKSVKFPYIDANCRPKINWSDDLIDDNFFHSLHELKYMIVRLTGCGNVLLFLIYSYFLLQGCIYFLK